MAANTAPSFLLLLCSAEVHHLSGVWTDDEEVPGKDSSHPQEANKPALNCISDRTDRFLLLNSPRRPTRRGEFFMLNRRTRRGWDLGIW